MGKGQRGPLFEIGLDIVLIDRLLVLVRSQYHDQIGALDGVGHLGDLQPRLLRLAPGRGPLAQGDHYLRDPGIAQVQRVRMALGAIANHRDLLAANDGNITVFVVIHLHDRSPDPGLRL